MVKLTKRNTAAVFATVDNVEMLIEEYQRIRTLDINPIHEVQLYIAFSNTLCDTTDPSRAYYPVAGLRMYHRNSSVDEHYFIHIPRCAGNSILKFMKDNKINFAEAFQLNPADPESEDARPVSHISVRKGIVDYFSYGSISSARLDQSMLKDKNINIISSVRNPYSWLVSFYFFGKKSIEDPQLFEDSTEYGQLVLGCGNVRRYFPTFEQFFNFFIKDVEPLDPLAWLKPFRKNPFFQLYDEEENLIPTKIIKLENFESDIKACFNIENFETIVANKGSYDDDYRLAYTPEMRQKFKEKYGFLLESFGYDFDGLIK